MWVITLHAEFDRQLDEPVPVHHSHYCMIELLANYYCQLQETWHSTLPLPLLDYTVSQKNDNDVAHYNFNAH